MNVVDQIQGKDGFSNPVEKKKFEIRKEVLTDMSVYTGKYATVRSFMELPSGQRSQFKIELLDNIRTVMSHEMTANVKITLQNLDKEYENHLKRGNKYEAKVGRCVDPNTNLAAEVNLVDKRPGKDAAECKAKCDSDTKCSAYMFYRSHCRTLTIKT